MITRLSLNQIFLSLLESIVRVKMLTSLNHLRILLYKVEQCLSTST